MALRLHQSIGARALFKTISGKKRQPVLGASRAGPARDLKISETSRPAERIELHVRVLLEVQLRIVKRTDVKVIGKDTWDATR